jgi:hypothetical protein
MTEQRLSETLRQKCTAHRAISTYDQKYIGQQLQVQKIM